jgi:ATPase subunit of ABC transporter with duplicated ATPase domains
MTNNSLLVGEQLSYTVAGRQLFHNLTVSFGNEKTGLVGANGIGKTTLLRLLLGQLTLDSGVVHTNGYIGYLPQDFVVRSQDTIAQVLGIERQLAALHALQTGVGAHHDQEIIGDDWDIKERTDALFSRLGLAHLAFSRKLETLSGGETTRVFLASLLLKKPAFLILDEPTNNLDRQSRQALYETIKQFDGGLLVVSHDRKLLSLMDCIAELSTLGLKNYGGNYAAYVEQKNIEQQAKEQQLVDAQKTLKNTKKVVQQTKERYEKRASKGKKAGRLGGAPRIGLGAQKERSEHTKSKLEKMTDKLLEHADDKLGQAHAQLERKELLDFELEATYVHSTKKVLEINKLTFGYPGCLPIINNFSLTIVGPERIAITGANGSGKTTLLKLIAQQLQPTAGTMSIGVQHVVYLDQYLSILDQQQTVLENFKRLNPDEKETECRTRLAIFLFSADAALKKVAYLSGGEKMRAALACILMGQQAPQLILLDEPTNNMDLESIASIERTLRSYKGALIAVSHDVTFLQNIGIEKEIEILKNK